MELLEFALASSPYTFNEIFVVEADEVGEGAIFAILLSHEKQGDVWGEDDGAGRQFCGLETRQADQPLAAHAVSDLVVILGADHELFRGPVRAGVAVMALAKLGVAPGEYEAFAQRLDQIANMTEIRVIAKAFLGQKRMQGVMKIIAPLGVHAGAAYLRGPDQARIVEIALRNQQTLPPVAGGEFLRLLPQLLQKGFGGKIVDGMHRIEPQGIDMIVPEPVQSVLQEVAPYLVAVRSVKVDRLAPGGAIVVGEVGSEVTQVIAFRAEVVVNHVEDDRQVSLVGGVDQFFQTLGATVAVLHRKGENAVVTPVAGAGELGDRHQFDGGDPHVAQFLKARNNRVEGALRGECSDVQFIDDHLGQGPPLPVTVTPGERLMIYDLRGAMHAVGLVT